MTGQRQLVAGIVAMALVATAGCNVLVGDEPLEYEASPVTIPNETLSETGYESAGVSERLVTRNFSAASRERQVNVTNQLARYERAIDLGPLGSIRAAVAATFSSPQVTVLGEEFNPIEDLSTREILTRFASEYKSITVGSQIGSRNVTSLGETRTLQRFEGTAVLSGQEIDVYIEATAAFAHGDDFVVFVAIYPQQLSGEHDVIMSLFRALEHES